MEKLHECVLTREVADIYHMILFICLAVRLVSCPTEQVVLV